MSLPLYRIGATPVADIGSNFANEDQVDSSIMAVSGGKSLIPLCRPVQRTVCWAEHDQVKLKPQGIFPIGTLPPPSKFIYTHNKENWEVSYDGEEEKH